MDVTKSTVSTETKLMRISEMSRQNPECEFKWLMPHFNLVSLTNCFFELDGRKALGVDGISKDVYRENLQVNIEQLISRMKTMSYRPGAVREVRIPKEGAPGAFRPLGISNFEDKIVQLMTAKILTAIYEPVFRDCSYGFRPKRSCHLAVKSLAAYLHRHECEVVIDVDLKNFFGTLNHEVLLGFLRMRIKDDTFLRYISRMLKSGIFKEGAFHVTDEGSPQGNVASPILSNIYAHHVLDVWFEDVVKKHVSGPVEMFRYCDDLVICCRYRKDGERVLKALEGRLNKYSLELNEEKTKLVSFSRKGIERGEKQDTFDFLGFTFYLGKTLRGNVTAKVRTSKKRFRSKLARVKEWVRKNRNVPMRLLWTTFVRKLRGHLNYYGVSFNSEMVSTFFLKARRIFFNWMNRRSQKRSLNWDEFSKFVKLFPLPTVKVQYKLY
jgi:RNA-directed DNA polymerase